MTSITATTTRLSLSGDEVQDINKLLDKITARYRSSEDLDFLHASCLHGHALPERLRAYLNDFRLKEPERGYCVVSGFPMDERAMGRTPVHWKDRSPVSPTLREEILLILMGTILGDAFGWSTQQDGYLVHDISPIKGLEKEQLGTGSEELLWWHTEDAFHEYRGEYIGFMCLRNPDQVATTFGSIADVDLTPDHKKLLFQKRYTIRPDESHLPKNCHRKEGLDDHLETAFQKIRRQNTRPGKVAVLFGSPDDPYIRCDPYFMDPLIDDEEAQAALDELVRQMDRVIKPEVFQQGDFAFIDNLKVVHGRQSFKARYDGRDRWLKRICITRDLRRSRDARGHKTSRTIL